MPIETNSSGYNYFHYKLQPIVISKENRLEYAEKCFQEALASGVPLQQAKDIKTGLMLGTSLKGERRATGIDGEVIELKTAKKVHTCDKLLKLNDELWKTLIAGYDMENLSYDDRRELAKDFEKHGLISEKERDQLIDEFDHIEEVSKSKRTQPTLEHDTKKYPTIYDYLRENVKEASPEACAAMRESMVVRNKFEHYIEHMKTYT